MKNKIPVITIDGNSGVGKGTIAQKLAKTLKWNYLDSGKLYRVFAYLCSITDRDLAFSKFNNSKIEFINASTIVDGVDITKRLVTDEISMKTSEIAKNQAVRTAVNIKNLQFKSPPGLIADGRDMGSCVFKDADFKFFFVADAQVRAERRYKQLKAMNYQVVFAEILENIIARDKNDSKREISPTQVTKKSIIIDTTNFSIDQVFDKVIKKITKRDLCIKTI